MVSDGEFGKSILWNATSHERLAGVERGEVPADPGCSPTDDAAPFPEFSAEYAEVAGLDRPRTQRGRSARARSPTRGRAP